MFIASEIVSMSYFSTLFVFHLCLVHVDDHVDEGGLTLQAELGEKHSN